MTLAVSFATQSISTLLLAELSSAACSSWQGVTQVPAEFQFVRSAYPAVKYRRVIVDAALTSEEQWSAVHHVQHLWLTVKT